MPRQRMSFLDILIAKYPDNVLLAMLIEEIYEYYRKDKYANGTVHGSVFFALFKEGNTSYDAARANYVHEDTAGEWARKKYSEFAKELIKADYIPGIKEAFEKDINL